MGYILAFPLIFLEAFSFSRFRNKSIRIVNYLLLALIFIAFFISSVDIPYFNYNFARLSAVIFEWASDTSMIISMIIEEPSYIIYTGVFVLFFALYSYLSFKASRRLSESEIKIINTKTISINIISFLLATFFVFFAMRGRTDSPIRINHAFFSNNSFYNQLGLNPVFTLLKSAKQNSSIKVIDDKKAIENTQSYLGITNSQHPNFPLSRTLQNDSSIKSPNIVMVIMESMSANKLTQFGNREGLTPFLDSLATKSINFKNIYSAGRHTCDGIFASLYSYPAVLR